MKTVFIYALNDPTTGQTRYIGKAANLAHRYGQHLRSREKNYRSNWIRSLVAQGLKPELELLDSVSVTEWPMWEVAYIQFFKDAGHALVNGTVGGEGVIPTEEVRRKQSVSATRWQTGRKLTQEHRHNVAESNRRKPRRSAEVCAKMAGEKNPFFGKRHTAETRAKISASAILRWEKKRGMSNGN